eukprot:TRINITY_DN404_c0_g1_i1.p1 TRINITY_DN404_c0_g1~~TRINITY_DN404_c0_g1_i1.p1  ORF type:complete len:318 (-),score=40.82 TRINITY_DN404_c0_g1_i1:175-1128(-)
MFGFSTIGQNSGYLPDRLKAKIATNRFFHTIDRVSLIDSSSERGLKPSTCKGKLELKGVHFSYPTRIDDLVFKNFNLKIEAGQTVALVGETGGGKSTVISLIERFYDPTKGCVLLDDVDLKEINVKWLREKIGLVSQEPVLFMTSIMDNIKFGKRNATEEEVHVAAKKANIHEFVMSLKDGYGTDVGNRGVMISGGQKQRIAIARAIIKDPEILLLDEATSALDSASEKVVQAALDSLLNSKRRTTIIVAHRLSTVQNADSLAVIYEGRIVEKGTHSELFSIPNGYYAKLCRRLTGKRNLNSKSNEIKTQREEESNQ